MRLRIRHATTYKYEQPARALIQVLRLSPRDHEGQNVVAWRTDLDRDCLLAESEDAFGNATHTFSTDGPIAAMTILVDGEVETFDTAGIVRGTTERFPPELFLRESPLAAAGSNLRAFAQDFAGREGNVLDCLHALLQSVHGAMAFDVAATGVGTSADEAFAQKRGVCQDFAHIFIAAARQIGVPARYVSGHLWRPDEAAQTAGHAWTEAFVPDLGWVGFDALNGTCVDERYVRIACGLDYLGAAPVRGARAGGDGETLGVEVSVTRR